MLSSQILQVYMWDMIFMLTYLQARAVPGGCPVSHCYGVSSLWLGELRQQWPTYVLCDLLLPDQSDAFKGLSVLLCGYPPDGQELLVLSDCKHFEQHLSRSFVTILQCKYFVWKEGEKQFGASGFISNGLYIQLNRCNVQHSMACILHYTGVTCMAF